jgi:alpha-beta hydrolase superfamily lysophospholipase
MSNSTLSTFTSRDGDNLALQEWPLADEAPQRGAVVLVHGLGEHAGRYEHVAEWLNAQGFWVRAYDQYGHGESSGPRGGLPADDRLLVDLGDVVESTRLRLPAGLPLIVLGHSMGGLVAARFVSLNPTMADGLVLSSPALDPGLNAVQKLLLAVVPRIAPNLLVGNGLNADFISHSPATVKAYRADPLVHDRISGRLAKFIADTGPLAVIDAPHWKVPTLLMYAGADKLVNPAGSRAFAMAAPSGMVSAQCFDALYHEIFNEPTADAAPVFACLQGWLDTRFPPA